MRLARARMIASCSAAQGASAMKLWLISNGERGHAPPYEAGGVSWIFLSPSWRGWPASSCATPWAISWSRCHSLWWRPCQLSRQLGATQRARLKRVMSSSIVASHATNAWTGQAQLGASPCSYASWFCSTVMRPIIRPQIATPIWRQCFLQIPGGSGRLGWRSPFSFPQTRTTVSPQTRSRRSRIARNQNTRLFPAGRSRFLGQ